MTTTTLSSSEALENQDFYYSQVQKDHFWFRTRMSFLKKFLEDSNISLDSKKGLEIGCGNSLVSAQIEQSYNCIVDGVDLTNAKHRFATKGAFHQVDITTDNGLAKDYDFIVLFDIIEHVSSPKEFIDHALKFLKPGGFVLINVPAYQFLFSKYDEVAGHLRRYHSGMLDHDTASLTKLDAGYWGLFFVPLVFLRKQVLKLSNKRTPQEIYNLGFTPPNKLINFILVVLAKFELLLLTGTTMGSSIMGVYQKKSEGPL